MLRGLFFIISFVIFITSGQAQDVSSLSLKQIPIIKLPSIDNAAKLAEELAERRPGRAPQYAHAFDVDIDVVETMVWQYEENRIVGRLIIFSEGAKSINLGFSQYTMPEGGKMYIYNIDKTEVRGPFTISDNEEHNQLWTPIVYGDKIVIEVSLPYEEANRGILALHLSSVNHDYVGFGLALSGDCNLDVICSAANGWGIVDDYRDIIQSVAVISTGGTTFCTGFLIDNIGHDCKPYFMTAYHCGIGEGSAPSLVTYWNFENSYCREPNSVQSGGSGDGQLNDFNTGSIFRARYAPSDFALVELDDDVSETANAFFAGFDATGTNPTNAIGVHHPNTDEKRISFENDPLIFTDYGGTDVVGDKNHVRIQDWDIGTTEPGSSGSPLFDQNKRIIGQLHGGGAACGNDLSDWYGTITHSWEGGGTPTTQLKYWLDPNNTGTLVSDGRYDSQCNFQLETPVTMYEICDQNSISFQVTISDIFTANVDMSITGLPVGVQSTFSPDNVAPNGTTTVEITGLNTLSSGAYALTINGANGNGEMANVNIDIIVSDGIVSSLSGLTPANNSLDQSTDLNISWTPVVDAMSYDFELSSMADFSSTFVVSLGVNSSDVEISGLMPATRYYWRVRATNACGVGEWVVSTFETGEILCSEKTYTSAPVVIDDNGPNTVYSTIEITDAGSINDINVINVKGEHTYIGDLIMTLISPSGTEVVLFDQVCFNENDFDLSFDDASSLTTLPCPPIDGNTYQPTGSLASLIGEDIQGTWQLKIEDVFSNDGGQLDDWGIAYCLVSPSEPVYEISTTTTQVQKCENELYSFDILLSTGFLDNVTLTANGVENVSFNPNPALGGQTVTVTLGDGNVDIDSLTIMANDGSHQSAISLPMEIYPLPTCVEVFVYDLGTRLPTFQWAEVGNSTVYTLDFYRDNNLINHWETNETSITVTELLDYETNYRLELIETNFCGEIVCDVLDFKTAEFGGTFDLGENPFKLYPIPTSDQLYLEFAKAIPFLEWRLFDMGGKRLIDGKFTNKQTTSFNLESLASGVYLLELQTKDNVEVIKVVRN